MPDCKQKRSLNYPLVGTIPSPAEINLSTDHTHADSEYKVEDRQIPVDGGEIAVRCVFPTPSEDRNQGPYPILVWYHGGGDTSLSAVFEPY